MVGSAVATKSGALYGLRLPDGARRRPAERPLPRGHVSAYHGVARSPVAMAVHQASVEAGRAGSTKPVEDVQPRDPTVGLRQLERVREGSLGALEAGTMAVGEFTAALEHATRLGEPELTTHGSEHCFRALVAQAGCVRVVVKAPDARQGSLNVALERVDVPDRGGDGGGVEHVETDDRAPLAGTLEREVV